MGLIEALFLAYLVLFPFGQLTKLSVMPSQFPEVHLYLTDIVVSLLLFSWGIWRFLLVKRKYQSPPLLISIFLFSIVCLLSLGLASPLLSSREVLVAGLYLLRWLVYAGLYFVVADLRGRLPWAKRPVLLNFLIILGITVAVLGLVQYGLWPNLRALEALEWDPHVYRLVGTFLDPGFTGIILVLTLVLLVNRFWPKASQRNSLFMIHFLLFVLVYLALALTHSRASYLAYLVAMAVIAIGKKAPRFLAGVVGLGILTLVILPRPAGEGGKLSRTYSVEARISNWQQTVVITQDHPLIGVGFNVYRYAQRDYGFLDETKWKVSHSGAGGDSSLLFVLATTGILGLIVYLWLWLKALLSTRSLLVFSSLAALFTHAFFLNSLFYPWIMAWVWILLATESS